MVCVNVPLGTKEKRATLVSATLILVIVLILSACLVCLRLSRLFPISFLSLFVVIGCSTLFLFHQ